MHSTAIKHEAEVKKGMDEVPVVIVGTGPAGIRAAEEILKRKPGQSIVMFGEEPWEPYNRVRLSSLLSGELNQSEIANLPRVHEESALMMHYHSAVVSINTNMQLVLDEHGRRQRYSRLVIATGSRPHKPEIPGIHRKGVFTFRDMNDVQELLARRTRTRHTVVLGGGLLGLEAARAMQRMNTEVTIIEHAPHLMSRQLDESASELLREHVLSLGMQVILANGVTEILGDGEVQGIRLRNGREIQCDTVIVATGIRPAIDLARKARITVGRGVQVNDYMETSAENVYAIGECAEHRGKVIGLVAPGLEQAAVVAESITGGSAKFLGSASATRLKILDKEVFSMGEVTEESSLVSCNVYVYNKPEKGIYRKIVLRSGKLIGAIGIGEWQELQRIQEVINFKRRIMPWQSLRFMRSGNLWQEADGASVVDWPDSAVVCNCRGVKRGDLGAVMDQGCDSVACLSRQTGASTVCGSCKPLLGQLVDAPVEKEKAPGSPVLAVGSLLAIVMASLWLLFQPIPTGSSVESQVYQVEALWRDGLFKQISGFTLLGLSLLGLLVSMRKRWKRFSIASFGSWRAFHAITGVLALCVLVLHTGLQFGENLNGWLLTNFLLIAALGAFAGWSALREQRRSGYFNKQLRRWMNRVHLVLAWPLPVLLGFHIVSVYYF